MGVSSVTEGLCFLGLLPVENCDLTFSKFVGAGIAISRHVFGALLLNSMLFLGEVCIKLRAFY